MGYTLKTNIANSANIGGSRNTNKIKYIVVHYTANDGDTDEANGKYFHNNKVKSSAHYFVDDDSVTQSVHDNQIAWHCGGSKQGKNGASYYGKCTNTNSIGIEMCDTQKNGKSDLSSKTRENAIALIKDKMKQYNVPVGNVIRHYDVTGKICPKYFVEDEKAWNGFKLLLTTKKQKYTGTLPKLPLRGYFYYRHEKKNSKGKITQTAKVMDKGTQVLRLQMFLNWAINAGLKLDSSFGPLVEKAVLKYQKTYGLTEDGFFGSQCLKKAKTIEK